MAEDRGKSGPKGAFKFLVNQDHFESSQRTLTGAQIKAIAHVEPTVQLFEEQHGRGADKQINDDTLVELEEHGVTRFYTMPPATLG